MNARKYPVNRQRGVVLVAALLILAILSLLGVTLLGLAGSDANMAVNAREHAQAFYGAEAALESALVDLRNLLATTLTPTDAQLAAITPRALSDPTLAVDGLQVRRVRPAPPFSYQTVLNQRAYQGLAGQTTDYEIVAQVRGPRGARARLTQVVQYLEVPLFRFGVFYGRGVDLEIGPDQSMTLSGRVHANGNLYVVANAGLEFHSFVSAAGNLNRSLKSDGTLTRYGNPQIKDPNGTLKTLNFDHQYGPNFSSPWSADNWASAALSTFGGRVGDSAMGVQEVTPRLPDLFYGPANAEVLSHQLIERGQLADSAAMQQDKLYYQAGLRVVDGVATNQVGEPVSLPAGVVTPQTFYDAREQALMTVVQVDIGALRASGQAPPNGILYVAAGGSNQGVRLVNGAQLPSGGFTVVSENPAYIQGDYNTVNKVPAAVLADAITVLSNNWGPNASDSKGDQATSSRPASNTTVNAALALGPSAESVAGQSNGRLENVIRLLENWNGVTFTYQGSILVLWHSQRATGAWRCCGDAGTNYYTEPIRNWSYDPSFNTSLPPGTPPGILIRKGRWADG
jgi:hypothetical protein